MTNSALLALVAAPLAAAGLVLLVPSTISFAALALLVVGVALQVTLVEGPDLRRVHGRSFEEYRQDTGRFLPRRERRSTT